MPSSKGYKKTCAVCNSEFTVTAKNGIQRFCNSKCKGKWKYVSNKVTTESQYAGISDNWERYLSRLIYSGGKKREGLSVEILMELLEKQDYKCALSGLPLTCKLEKGKKFHFNVSIDRLGPGGPYTKENIQLVGRSLNSWRADTSVEDFIAICKAVAEHNKEKET